MWSRCWRWRAKIAKRGRSLIKHLTVSETSSTRSRSRLVESWKWAKLRKMLKTIWIIWTCRNKFIIFTLVRWRNWPAGPTCTSWVQWAEASLDQNHRSLDARVKSNLQRHIKIQNLDNHRKSQIATSVWRNKRKTQIQYHWSICRHHHPVPGWVPPAQVGALEHPLVPILLSRSGQTWSKPTAKAPGLALVKGWIAWKNRQECIRQKPAVSKQAIRFSLIRLSSKRNPNCHDRQIKHRQLELKDRHGIRWKWIQRTGMARIIDQAQDKAQLEAKGTTVPAWISPAEYSEAVSTTQGRSRL